MLPGLRRLYVVAYRGRGLSLASFIVLSVCVCTKQRVFNFQRCRIQHFLFQVWDV